MIYVYKNFSIIKKFNDDNNTSSGIYYPSTDLFIIENLNIIGVYDEYMTQEPECISRIEIIKSKWLDYYKNIPIIYLFEIIFYPRYKLDYLSDCLEIYYKYLASAIDIPTLVTDVR